jgi:hypothetical protein
MDGVFVPRRIVTLRETEPAPTGATAEMESK